MLTSTAPPQGTGAVAHYSFDEGSGTTANDTGLAPNNVGTLATGASGTGNGPDWTTDPADRKFGTSSLRFDATASQRDMVVVQDEASLNPTNQISFSAWIKATDWNGNRRVLQKSQGNSDTQYRFLAENGQFHFRLEGGANPPGSITAPLPPVGQFVHVVGQYDGSAMELFYDGVSVARRAVTAPLNVTTGTLRLGTKEESVTVDGDYFNGILDEIFIFGRGLNRREIVALRDNNTWLLPNNLGTGVVDVTAGATLNLGGFRNHESANVAGRLNLTPNGTDAGTSSVDALNITGTGVLDLANNDMVVFSTSGANDAELAAVYADIVSAQNGVDANFITNWNGPGLTSSTARAANVASNFDLVGIGAIRNSDIDVLTGLPGSSYTTFGGLAVTPDDILIKYTYIGDGNLDGLVSFDDYVGMDNAFFGLIPNLGWATGDINFDGVINFDDYSVVDQAFFFQGAPLSGEGSGVAAVPEPGTWLLAALASLTGLFTWFRRKK